jgi:hypothetical protein
MAFPATGDAVRMASADMTLTKEAEAERVLNWRFEELERAGYPTDSANELAERTDVDLHTAVALARAGCPVDTALRILL